MSAEELIEQIDQWTADFLGITVEEFRKQQAEYLQNHKGE